MNQASGRRLAAVLALDIVGYSRMMGMDEARTLGRLLHRRKTILDPLVVAHRGRIIKGTGDGILAEFASARDALHAAIQIQRALAATDRGEPGDPAMLARIGINTGDVIFAENDIYGDGVNIAARLEASAPSGGICLSGNTLEEARRLGVAHQDAGDLDLKNIAMPIRAYHIPAEAIAAIDDRLVAPEDAPASATVSATRDPHPIMVRRPGAAKAGTMLAAIALILLVMGGWWWLGSSDPSPQRQVVRLAGFQPLSPDLPATIGSGIDAEIAAAFNADGVVGVSAARSSASSAHPTYALGGTIQRSGATLRVIARLTNELSGATVWGNDADYDASELAKVPRRIAVDVGNVVRCGLFGASTYREPLPDPVLGDYLRFCQGHWDPNTKEGRKALVPAQRVVAAVPDFSWGWAAVAAAYWKVAGSAESPAMAEEARAAGRQAADRAIAIDPANSEALYIKAMVTDRRDWVTREALLKRAIAARRLDCGCEFHQYGWLLMNVGRLSEAVERLRQATDMLAYYVYTPLNLADALLATNKPDEAKPLFKLAAELAPDADFAKRLAASEAARTGDIAALNDPAVPIPAELRAALLSGYRAAKSDDAGARKAAVHALIALPADQQQDAVAMLLADLGATGDAFRIAARRAEREYPGPSIFWYRRMRATLDDPGFPPLAEKLGLMTYWRATHALPDVCRGQQPPRFCRMI